MSDASQAKQPSRFGRGSIVFWRGGSLWIGYAEDETGFHAHHSIQITLSLSSGTVRFRSAGEDWTNYAAAIIAAHHSHAFEARGEQVALLFAEPESREGQQLRERYRCGVSPLDVLTFRDEVTALAAAYADGAGNDEIAARARAIIAKIASTEAMPLRLLDKRIDRAIEILREGLGETVTMAAIAEAVHLSPERFRHLFLKETGIRFRPYVLWLRIEVALAAYAAGKSLTEAAFAGGFADSAHLSRTFKRMFGVSAVGVHLH